MHQYTVSYEAQRPNHDARNTDMDGLEQWPSDLQPPRSTSDYNQPNMSYENSPIDTRQHIELEIPQGEEGDLTGETVMGLLRRAQYAHREEVSRIHGVLQNYIDDYRFADTVQADESDETLTWDELEESVTRYFNDYEDHFDRMASKVPDIEAMKEDHLKMILSMKLPQLEPRTERYFR